MVFAVVPAVITVGYGGLLPDNSWDKLMALLVSDDKQKSITGGKPQKGFAAAYATLKANNYHSYLWCPEAPIGVKREDLDEKFIKSSMPNFRPDLFLGTAGCCRDSQH